MDELNFAEETTTRMKNLYGLAGSQEVIRRTIISRIYYSAHHLSRYLLRQVGLRPDTWRRNVHQRVIDEMQRQFVATNMMNSEVTAFLKDMFASLSDYFVNRRRNRVKADYQLHLAIRERHVENIFDIFDTYLNECRQLLEVIA
ncbi:hypothetical protein H8D98_00585 [bacterium]|nr:hypothetical protein [bacterium]